MTPLPLAMGTKNEAKTLNKCFVALAVTVVLTVARMLPELHHQQKNFLLKNHKIVSSNWKKKFAAISQVGVVAVRMIMKICLTRNISTTILIVTIRKISD